MSTSAQNAGDKPAPHLNVRQKIFVGGLGALTPIIMNLLVVDLEKLLIQLTPLVVFAYIIKVLILFYIGGMVAYLNKDENKPIKLFQLGIYAPALIIAFMNTNPLQTGTDSTGLEGPIFNTQPASPQPDAAPGESPGPDKEERTGNSSPIANTRIFSASAARALAAGDSLLPAISKRVSRLKDSLLGGSLPANSLLVTPMLESMVEKDTALLDEVMDKVSIQKKMIENTALKDTAVYRFSYPEETITEQLMRGIFGVKSERVWYVILDKFGSKRDAEMYAKLITLELGKLNGNGGLASLRPTLYVHHDPTEAEYSVVVGKQMRYQDARQLLAQISHSGVSSLTSGNAELWKFE